MRHSAIVLSHYSQHALLGLSLSGRVSNPLPCVAWRCFARRGANLSTKQMKMDSEATADTKCHESELTFLSSICMHSHEKKKKLFPFPANSSTARHTHRRVSNRLLHIGQSYEASLLHTSTEKHTNTSTYAWNHTAWKLNAYLLMSCHGDRYCNLIGW